MNSQPEHNPQEELLTRFIDGECNEALHPEWIQEKTAANQLGNLLRAHLPSRLEPPSEEFFTAQLMQKISSEAAPSHPPQRISSPSFFEKFRLWLAPLAATAAVLVVGGILLKDKVSSPRDSFAYTPIANVKATLSFNSDADATVINLEGLEAIPDDQEIKAFSVANSKTAKAGEPQKFFAANDPSKLLFVLFPSDSSAPSIHLVQ